jgi:predicted DNA-binding transcriptional regulator YafY
MTVSDDSFDDVSDGDVEVRPLTKSEQKLQRWVDLLAALLIRHRHATFEELAKDVPGYSSPRGQPDSVLRTFERDKDELRRFGVPIDTAKDAEGNPLGYRIDRKGFYLPFLMVTGHERASHPSPSTGKEGYRSLQTLAFEPDEIDVILQAAARIHALRDPVLAGEVEAALRKLALDLPLGVGAKEGSEPSRVRENMRVVAPRNLPDGVVFDRLSDALARRKAVTFDYFTMERDESARRTVEPFGLFFVSSHWYLAARDVEKDGVRNFRLSRIENVAVNTKKSQSTDYQVPSTFVLRDHAQSREPWEIGEGDATSAVVEFTATTGATKSALRLGQPIPGSSIRRRFAIRRQDTFARWLLSFGGDARPIEPPELCAEYARLAAETLARYAGTATEERS